MKAFNRIRSICAAFACITTLTLAAFASPQTSARADDNQGGVFATLKIAGRSDLLNVAERIAKLTNYEMQFQGIREFVEGAADGKFPFKDAPIVAAIASNDETVVPFAVAKLADPDQLDESALDSLNELVKDKLTELDVALFREGDSLYFAQSQYKDFVSSFSWDALAQSSKKDEGSVEIVSASVDLTKLDKNLVEAACAIVREKVSEIASESDVENFSERLDEAFAYYFEIFECVERASWSLSFDSKDNLVTSYAVEFKEKSYIAEQLAKSKDMPTKWSVIDAFPNAIFSTVDAGVFAEQSKKYNASHFKKVAHDNVLNQLDVLIDNPDDFELAKNVYEHVEKAILADLQADTHDGGVALLAEPVAFVFAANAAAPNELHEAVKLLVDKLAKSDSKAKDYLKFDAEKVGDFSVSTFNAPFNDFINETPRYLDRKTFAARLAFSNDAVLLAVALNPKDADAFIEKLVDGSKKDAPQKREACFDLCKVAMLVRSVLETFDDVRPEALKSVERLEQEENAKIVFVNDFNANRFEASTTITSETLKTLGDIIRINVNGVVEDDSADMDAIFDEE